MITVQTLSRSLSLRKIIEILESRNQESGIKGLENINVIKNDSSLSLDFNILDSIKITGITQDSRKVQPGFLFVAIKGAASDGADFIPMAIEKGAVAVLCEAMRNKEASNKESKNSLLFNSNIPDSIIFLTHSNPKLALAWIAANFYGQQPEIIAAITGTNGKTSTAYFCTQIWQLLGRNSASIGTIGIVTSDGSAYGATGSMTTPDPIKLHEILADLANAGITNLAMEASSHGLDQYRLDGVNVKAAAFTNITRDHLDYHGTFENYFAAKLRLFDVMKHGVAVINADISESEEIIKLCGQKGHKVLSVGKKGRYIELLAINKTSNGQQIAFEVQGRVYNINTHLIGEFQAYNLLTALALVAACGANIDDAVNVLEKVAAVPGRMQGVSVDEVGARVYIDYAHTPDALEKALTELRPHTKGNLWVVFGCGGDRDKGKRPQMGEVAARLADFVLVTDDNPRNEVPGIIRSQVMEGCPGAKQIGDRFEAIEYAISNMQINDMLLIAGKGHEKTQIIVDKILSFDDVKVATEILQRKQK